MADPTIQQRACARCGEVKPATEFYTHGKRRDWLNPNCKECCRERSRARFAAKKGEILQKQKAYYQANKEHIAERDREYRQKNADRIVERRRTYYQDHKAENRERSERWVNANRERHAESKRAYAKANRDRVLRNQTKYRQSDKGRRQREKWYRKAYAINAARFHANSRLSKARRKAAAGTCSYSQWVAKCEFWGWRCYLCRIPLEGKPVHMEHRKPVVRGGSNWPANLAPACAKCNQAKNSKTEAEYRASLAA